MKNSSFDWLVDLSTKHIDETLSVKNLISFQCYLENWNVLYLSFPYCQMWILKMLHNLLPVLCFFQEYFYPKYVGKFLNMPWYQFCFACRSLFWWRTLFVAACLGSHRVGINNQNSDSGIPSDLRTCVKGEGVLWYSICAFLCQSVCKASKAQPHLCKAFIKAFINIPFVCPKLFAAW